MKMTIKQLITLMSTLGLLQLSWWGSWIEPSDYQFGVDTQRLAGQQINSDNTQREDQHFLEKKPSAPPIKADEKNNN